jgi:TMEM175 potassium channel family protein
MQVQDQKQDESSLTAERNKVIEESAGMSRLEAFSDGVFAVAITLLALQFTVPTLNDLHNGDLASQVFSSETAGKYISYLLSFMVIGIIWVNHHITFRYIRRMNRKLLSLNILLLMCVSFIPYPTAILGEYIGNDQQKYFATEFYSGTMFVASSVFYLIWLYGVRNGRLVGNDVDMELVRRHSGRGLLAPALYLLSFIIAFFNVYISLAIYTIIAVLFIIPLETDRFL